MIRLPAALAVLLAASTARAELVVENAWLRPAYAGQPSAMVYLEIRSSEALKLVGARSPEARRAELVLVDPPDRDPARHKVVKELPVAANAKTRLAFLGSHVRLVDIKRDLLPGANVTVELEFADAKGKRRSAATQAVVRGLTAPRRPDPEHPREPPNPTK